MGRPAKVKTTDTRSVILTLEQIDTIESLQRKRSTPYAQASFAAVVREIVDAGLEVVSHGPNMIFDTSTEREAA